jgi:hypothetical protein
MMEDAMPARAESTCSGASLLSNVTSFPANPRTCALEEMMKNTEGPGMLFPGNPKKYLTEAQVIVG